MKISRYCLYLTALLLWTAVRCSAGENSFHLGDATGGTRLAAVHRVFFRMSRQEKYRETDFRLVRLQPAAAVEKLRSGELDAVIIETRDIPAGSAFRRRFFAAEALTVCTGESNPLEGLTPEQLKEIWKAEHPSWRKYNRWQRDIHRLGLKFHHGGFVEARFLGGKLREKGVFRSSSTAQAHLYCSGSALLCQPFSGVMPDGVKMLKINGVMPGKRSILSGEYPLSLHYIILLPAKDDELREEFLRQLFSGEMVEITRDSGLIPAEAGGES